MRTIVAAMGYINVVTVLNMKRFVTGGKHEQDRFEAIRGTSEFAQVIKNKWGTTVSPHGIFSIADEVKKDYSTKDQMTTEQVGYSTGVFRTLILEQQTFPTYIVNKQKVKFPDYLLSNYQFSRLFLDVWENWDVFIRPVYTGLFILRLLRKHSTPETLLNMAKNVNRLQESFDVPSAFNWLQKIRNDQTITKTEKEKKAGSIRELLFWLGGESDESKRLQYLPVQPRLAMEVASLFVEEIANEIPILEKSHIKLDRPLPRRSIPLHDSYVVYHLDKLFVNKSVKQHKIRERQFNGEESAVSLPRPLADTLEEISVEAIKDSFPVQQQLCNLMEGAVLKSLSSKSGQQNSNILNIERFPALRPETVHQIMEKNLSSWEDELCLMMTRSAIFLPSKKFRNYQLVVTNLSRSTSHIKYIRYWGSIERMVELVLSVRVLAQLLERLSYSLLGRIASEMHKIRSELLKGDIKMDSRALSELLSEAANLQRLASLCQGLSDPHVWSRAEYGIVKAQRLIDELGILLALEHIQRNLDAINQLGDHIDELYLGDLAEENNNFSFWSSMGLAGLSLILTVLILPSFWADMQQLNAKSVSQHIIRGLPIIDKIGDFLAIFLIIGASFMFLASIVQMIRTKRIGNLIGKRFKVSQRNNR